MKKLQDWAKTWTPPQVIMTCCASICVTAFAIVLTLQDDWGKLLRWLSDPASVGLLMGLATLAGTLYHRALGLEPTPDEQAVATRPVRTPPSNEGGFATIDAMLAVVVIAALGYLLSGCGAQLTDSQRSALTLETQRCIANERAIVDREGSTAQQDEADLIAERIRCNATRAAIIDGGVP